MGKKDKKASNKKKKKHKKEKPLKQVPSDSLTRFDPERMSRLAGSRNQLTLVKCKQCNGQGEIGPPGLKHTCPTCGGTGRASTSSNQKYQSKLNAAHKMRQDRIRKQQQQNQQRLRRQQQLRQQQRRRR